MKVFRKNLERENIPWSFPDSETDLCLKQAGFYTTTTNTEYLSKPWSAGYYCAAESSSVTQTKRLWFEAEGNIFIFIIGITNFIWCQ